MIDLGLFIQRGRAELEPYVSGIDDFVACQNEHSRPKSELRLRPAHAYIRNMLAVGVLGRIMRPAFLETTHRLIVLPDCLKNYSDWECGKVKIDGAHTCAQCHPECIVFNTVGYFVDDQTSLVLEPDDLGDYLGKTKNRYGTVGVVGVACVLTILSGFEQTLKHRLPTQGVFLNYSSCSHHWADPPYNTCYSLRRMAWTLGKDISSVTDDLRDRRVTYSLERGPLTPTDFYSRLDMLAGLFETDYLPSIRAELPRADIYEMSHAIRCALVPDLITRDSA